MTLMEHLTRIVEMLRAAIGVQLTRQLRQPQPVWIGTTLYAPRPDPNASRKLPEPIWSLLWLRLGRLSARFTVLHAKWRENRLPTPRIRPKRARPTPTTPRLRLPEEFGWVNRRIPEAAPPTGMLDSLLHDPETRRFVAEAPQAGRLLRPLCQALGIRQPDWLRLPRRPRKPRRPSPRPERAPSFAAALRAIPADRPLEPYVLAAAKAARKFGLA